MTENLIPGTLADRIADTLAERLRTGVFPPGKAIPGVRRIAEEFGCSFQTADRAMRKLSAAKLISRRRGSGSYPVRRNFRIAWLSSTVRRVGLYHWRIAEIYETAARAALEERHCTVEKFTFSELCQRSFSPRLLDHFDGILIHGGYNDRHSFELIREAGVPVVCVSSYPVSHPFHCVRADWRTGMRELLDAIPDARKRRFHLWDMRLFRPNPSNVAEAFFAVAAEAGIPAEQIHYEPIPIGPRQSFEQQAGLAAKRLKQTENLIQVSTSDLLSFGILEEFYERGLRPGSFDLISCDNLEARGIGPWPEARLTAIDHPKEALVREAVRLLIRLIEERRAMRVTVELPTRLIRRQSGLLNLQGGAAV